MLRVLQVACRCATAKPSLGFLALTNKEVRAEVEKLATPKLEALAEVVQSLNNQENEYLNILMIEKSMEEGQSILANKLFNVKGYRIEPLQYFYHQEWIKEEWKDTEIMQFIHSQELQEAGLLEEVEVVKENYDVELTTVDVAQKIKVIKALREVFSLGLKEAKDFADKVPSMLKKNMKREQAQKLKKDLELVGCVITLK